MTGEASRGLAEAAGSGDKLSTLEALRDKLARQIDASGSGRDVAALSRQLTDVMDRIEAEKAKAASSKGTTLEAIQRRRAERLRHMEAQKAK